MPPRKKVPVTLVSGFKNVGKSSLVEHLRSSERAQRVAYLIDDGEKDLFKEIEDALEISAAEALVIECAAGLEPYFVVEYLLEGDEEGPPPKGLKIDTLVTVVDASTFMDEISNSHELIEHGLAFDADDDRLSSELLIEQVEFADILLINKIDLVKADDLALLEALLARLNPRAKILRATGGKVEASEVLRTGAFDLFETDDGAGWLSELNGEFSETNSVLGVSSFTFTDRRPFHPIRFNELLANFATRGLVRVKGYVWVATRHHEIGIWSLAGNASILTYGGAWFAATPARNWPEDPRERAEIMNEWAPPFGDRRQEIAFLGVNMNEREIRERLRECVLTGGEMKDGPDSWFAIPDPLPDWHVDTDPESYGPESWS